MAKKFQDIYIITYIKSYINIYIIVILAFTTSSCTEILFSDDEQTRTFNTGNFSSVIVDGTFEILLVQDSSDRVILKGTNRLDKTEVSVINDTLVIKDRGGFNPEPGRNKLEIHFTDIDYIVTRKPVNISNLGVIRGDRLSWDGLGEISEASLDVEYETLIICNSANTLGLISLEGKAGTFIVFNRYGSRIFAKFLSCIYAGIANESIGDIHVNASETLVVYLLGSGNIYYYGDPAISIDEKKGTGNLVRIP